MYGYVLNNWSQRAPFIFLDLCYLIILLFTTISFLKIIKVTKAKYDKVELILYYLSFCGLVLLRIIFTFTGEDLIRYPLAKISEDFPGMFMFSISTLFMNYLISGLCLYFSSRSKSKYSLFNRVSRIFLIIMLIIGTAVFSFAVYECEYTTNKGWGNTYFYIHLIASLCVAGFTIYIVKIYSEELKKFPVTFDNKKTIILFAIIAQLIQTVAKVTNSIFSVTGLWNKISAFENEIDFPWLSASYTLYVLLSDIMALISYTLYLKKDADHLYIVESTENYYEPDLVGTATIIEEHLLSYIINDGSMLE